tara:strand:- start:489 stop:827 length:339 start_codon:yes stop_codon:yes gene_type:complete
MIRPPDSKVTNYFVPPPYITTLRKVYNINNDPQLRKTMTTFYFKKSKKWMKEYKEFKHTKKNLKKIKSDDGFKIIYNLLRKFVKINKINWYELRNPNYELVKDFLKFELGKL